MSRETYRPLLNRMADHCDEYAGIPMPITGQPMVVHPGYKFASVVNRKPEKPEPRPRFVVRNQWKRPEGWDVVVADDTRTGKIIVQRLPHPSRGAMQLATLGIAASGAWDMKAEAVAQEKLRSLIRPHLFETYQLTGAFIETSPRSALTYLFRKMRPTLALTARKGDEMSILCALCLHPIGYYSGTWAGCMVPTDEVVAHLMLMRGDEADFWRQANQHPAWHPNSGL